MAKAKTIGEEVSPIILYNQRWIKILPGKNNEAFLLWPLIFVKRPKAFPQDSVYWMQKGILDHELVHWAQMRKYWIIGFYLLNIYYNIKYGYENNPFEREARKEQHNQ